MSTPPKNVVQVDQDGELPPGANCGLESTVPRHRNARLPVAMARAPGIPATNPPRRSRDRVSGIICCGFGGLVLFPLSAAEASGERIAGNRLGRLLALALLALLLILLGISRLVLRTRFSATAQR